MQRRLKARLIFSTKGNKKMCSDLAKLASEKQKIPGDTAGHAGTRGVQLNSSEGHGYET